MLGNTQNTNTLVIKSHTSFLSFISALIMAFSFIQCSALDEDNLFDGPGCGNGRIENTEECDGLDVNSLTCNDFNLGSGKLGCSASCQFDFSACGDDSMNIVFDYSMDHGGFFDHPLRRELMEQAASYWTKHIQEHFSPLPNNSTFSVRDPENRDRDLMTSIPKWEGDLRVFVGSTAMGNALAKTADMRALDSTWAKSTSDKFKQRFAGNDFQPWVSSMSFSTGHESKFFFDQTPATAHDIPNNKYDFLSVAIHELGHSLGIWTACTAFRSQLSTDTKTYSGDASHVHGAPVVMDGIDHFKQDLKVKGQPLVMDPGTHLGERNLPSQFELNVLKDIGYNVVMK